MLRLYYADPPEDLSTVSREAFSDYRRERLASLRNPEGRRLSTAAELLLIHAVQAAEPGCTLPLRLRTNAYGKPMLTDGDLHISLSHTADFVVCAVGDRELGVDAEKPRAYREALVRRFFCPEEQAFLRSSPDPDEDFTLLWTLKESYLKALGCGLNRPLDSFCVCMEPEPRLVGDTDTGFWHTKLKDTYISLCVPGVPRPVPERVEEIRLF